MEQYIGPVMVALIVSGITGGAAAIWASGRNLSAFKVEMAREVARIESTISASVSDISASVKVLVTKMEERQFTMDSHERRITDSETAINRIMLDAVKEIAKLREENQRDHQAVRDHIDACMATIRNQIAEAAKKG